MDVSIDRSRCSGHGRCFSLEPEMFADDEEGFGIVAVVASTPELEAAARRGASACPEQAIDVIE